MTPEQWTLIIAAVAGLLGGLKLLIDALAKNKEADARIREMNAQNETEQDKFNRDLYFRLDKSIERMADVVEVIGKTQVGIAETQAANTKHQAQTSQAVEQITLNLKTIGTDVLSWPKAATETADRLAKKFDDLEQLVTDLPDKLDLAKCAEIMTSLNDLKALIETVLKEVREKIGVPAADEVQGEADDL
jgi:hypothetical protein